ncbi:MAG: hypothetical protein DMF06_08985 [Verrucomicrobia bacterium]|nr:MAG: hypothetical protein DMF06_08985 [Verrucomicrobiota bacterium]
MPIRKVTIVLLSILLASETYATNPFLNAPNDRPVSAQFRGTEWSEEIKGREIPLTARVITTRLAATAWGAIFKVEFADLKSKAAKKREIPSRYFIVTDERIVLLNEEDNEAAAKKIAAMAEPPEFEPGHVYGIAKGVSVHEDRPWKTEIEVKGDLCVYLSSHNSGHFTKVVWKKGVGLVEYSSGYGAEADGYRLKRAK